MARVVMWASSRIDQRQPNPTIWRAGSMLEDGADILSGDGVGFWSERPLGEDDSEKTEFRDEAVVALTRTSRSLLGLAISRW